MTTRCSLEYADPNAPLRAFVSVVWYHENGLALLVKQPGIRYPEFTPYTVTLRAPDAQLTFDARPMSFAFLINGLNDTTDPKHQLVGIMTQPFDVIVRHNGEVLGEIEHLPPVPRPLGSAQAHCFHPPEVHIG